MKQQKLPKTDSIEELARFWDTHDLTDFEDELEEVSEPIFTQDTAVMIHLRRVEIESIKEIARSKGINYPDLIRAWILEQIENS